MKTSLAQRRRVVHAVAGSGVGTLLLSNLSSALVYSVGWRQTLGILAFITGVSNLCAALSALPVRARSGLLEGMLHKLGAATQMEHEIVVRVHPNVGRGLPRRSLLPRLLVSPRLRVCPVLGSSMQRCLHVARECS